MATKWIKITGTDFEVEFVDHRPEQPPVEPAPDLTDRYGGFIAVDPHCHTHGSTSNPTTEELAQEMVTEDLQVITPLAWGFGEGYDDRLLVTGKYDPAWKPGRIIHWDCEYSQTPSNKLGHLVTHGCPPHPTQLVNYAGKPTASTIPIAKWARENDALAIGMAHCQQ